MAVNSSVGSEHSWSSRPYCYTSLPTPTSIRLLKMKPRSEGPIECTMEIFDLRDHLTFNALSYTWGSPITIYEESVGETQEEVEQGILHNTARVFSSPPIDIANGKTPKHFVTDGERMEYIKQNPWIPRAMHHASTAQDYEITVDGRTLSITENLYHVLDDLSSKDSQSQNLAEPGTYAQHEWYLSAPIWIDAICINQDDIGERSKQVMLMSRIYKSASLVIAWLGPKDRLARLSLLAVEIVLKFQALPDRPTVATIHHLPDMTPGLWFSIFAMLQRLWFHRAWVVQEAVFAKSMIFRFGSKDRGSLSIEWNMFVSVVSFLSEMGLLAGLNIFGQSLMSGRPLHADLRRLFQDEIALEILECSGSDRATATDMSIDLESPVSVLFSIQEMKERLGLVESRRRMLYRIKRMSPEGNEISSKFEYQTTRFEPAIRPSNIEPNDRGLGFSEEKQIELVQSVAMTRKNEIVLAFFNNNGVGGVMGLERPLPVVEALSAFRNCNSTDSKDKIFAYLGISTEDFGIVPDYSKSTQEVFKEATKAILASTGSLDVLSQIQALSDTRTQHLPSWVPDFGVAIGKTALSGRKPTSFNASGQKWKAWVEVGSDWSLSVEGYKVDDITRVAQVDGDTTLNILQLALTTAPNYINIGGGPIIRSTLHEDVQIPDFENIVFDLRSRLPESTFYIAVGSAVDRIPPLSGGQATKDGVNEPPKLVQSRLNALWHCLIAFGWKYQESTPPHVWAEAFSDWLCCRVLESHKDATVLGSLTRKLSLPICSIQTAKRRLFEERVVPKLVAWFHLILGTQATHSLHLPKIKESVTRTDDEWQPVADWFPKYLIAAFTVIASLPPHLGLKADEVSGKRSVDLREWTKLLVLQDRLNSLCPERRPEPNTETLEMQVTDTFRDMKNIFVKDAQKRIIDFEVRIKEVGEGRRMFRTRIGLLGLGPESVDVEENDQVWILRGASVPFVLRPTGDGKFKIVGEAYVHGIMRGELVSEANAGFVKVSIV